LVVLRRQEGILIVGNPDPRLSRRNVPRRIVGGKPQHKSSI
jgi:hypothetical protein